MSEELLLNMNNQHSTAVKQHIQKVKTKDVVFAVAGLLCLLFCLVTLGLLVLDLGTSGWSRINSEFFTNFPSRFAGRAGILSAWVGSLCVMLVTAACAIPLGIAAAVYLEEYAPKNFFTTVIEVNINNLAAIPSITYGLMALGLFVYRFNLGQSILTAGLTLGLLVLPIVIVTTREAIRTIPSSMREASFALGGSLWQTIWYHILPYSSGGIFTGIIIALSRAIGETAPLVTIGALTFIAFLPTSPVAEQFPFLSFQWLHDSFTVLPIQMFNWVSRPQAEFHQNAAAAGIVLLGMTLIMNIVAIAIRYKFRKKYKW